MNHDIYTYYVYILKISKNGIAVASINIIKKAQTKMENFAEGEKWFFTISSYCPFNTQNKQLRGEKEKCSGCNWCSKPAIHNMQSPISVFLCCPQKKKKASISITKYCCSICSQTCKTVSLILKILWVLPIAPLENSIFFYSRWESDLKAIHPFGKKK